MSEFDPDRPDAARAREIILSWANKYSPNGDNVMADELTPDFVAHIAAALAAVRAEGEAAGAALAWTKEKPTKPGWYVNFYRGRRPYRIYEFTQADLDEGCLLHRDGLDEWYGPIPEPSARAQAGRGEG